jgi:nucleoporin NUP82
MRIKTYMLGPTTHVTTNSAIASAIWHPLGVNGTCLVTVTEDAVVRVWELSLTNHMTFEKATLAIDLKKLADGTSVDQDFGASISGSKVFSPDSFEMEVASACFAGRGSGGWSPMTLWIAMREGDVYALCPLLPEKWSPPSTLIPSLSISIVSKNAAIEDDPAVSTKVKLLARQQQDWLSEIDNQEPTLIDTDPGSNYPTEVFTRPSKPGRVPKLQGPVDFELAPEESEEEMDNLLTDIYVIGAKMDGDELMFGEEDELVPDDDVDQEGLSLGVVCLLASSGRLSICLDVDGIEAQWLPKSKNKVSRFVENTDPPSLLTFEVLDTSKAGEASEENWPMFSHDVSSRYSFYITDNSSITFMSLDWVFRLEAELKGSAPGTDFRIDLLVKGQNSVRQRIYPRKYDERVFPLAASNILLDPDVGYFLLTASPNGPVAITFESPEASFDLVERSRSPTYDSETEIKPEILYEPRLVYEPAPAFNSNLVFPKFLEKLGHTKFKRILKEEVRLSPATLKVMTEVHKILSDETHKLSTAAAELFRRCEKLQIELQDQIKKANEVANRIDAITGKDVTDGEPESLESQIARRIDTAKKNQTQITERIERLRKRAVKGTGRELSNKEKAWMEEIKLMESKILPQEVHLSGGRKSQEPWQRYQEIEKLRAELLEESKGLDADGKRPAGRDVRVPKTLRDEKVAEVWKLLDRETALVESAKSRMEKLSMSEAE